MKAVGMGRVLDRWAAPHRQSSSLLRACSQVLPKLLGVFTSSPKFSADSAHCILRPPLI